MDVDESEQASEASEPPPSEQPQEQTEMESETEEAPEPSAPPALPPLTTEAVGNGTDYFREQSSAESEPAESEDGPGSDAVAGGAAPTPAPTRKRPAKIRKLTKPADAGAAASSAEPPEEDDDDSVQVVEQPVATDPSRPAAQEVCDLVGDAPDSGEIFPQGTAAGSESPEPALGGYLWGTATNNRAATQMQADSGEGCRGPTPPRRRSASTSETIILESDGEDGGGASPENCPEDVVEV